MHLRFEIVTSTSDPTTWGQVKFSHQFRFFLLHTNVYYIFMSVYQVILWNGSLS